MPVHLVFMFKLMGLGLLFASFYLMGRSSAHRVEERPRELRAAISALEVLQTEVGYGLVRLGPALGKVATLMRSRSSPPQSVIGDLFADAARRLREGDGASAGEAWIASLRYLGGRCSLTDRDLELMADLADGLGASGSFEQVRHLQMVSSSLRTELPAAEADAARLGRVYRSVWTAVGGCAVLLVI